MAKGGREKALRVGPSWSGLAAAVEKSCNCAGKSSYYLRYKPIYAQTGVCESDNKIIPSRNSGWGRAGGAGEPNQRFKNCR